MSNVHATVGTAAGEARFPLPMDGFVLTQFIVSDDVERSRRFYTGVLGGVTVRSGEPTYVALANSWIIINVGADQPRTSRRSRSSPLATRTE